MAAAISSSLPAHSPAGCSPSAVQSAVKNAVQECNIRQSDLGAAANAAVCKPPSDWVCHVRHGPLLSTLERLEHLSHRGEFAFEALDIVVDFVRHKVRPIVAITKAAIGSGIRRGRTLFWALVGYRDWRSTVALRVRRHRRGCGGSSRRCSTGICNSPLCTGVVPQIPDLDPEPRARNEFRRGAGAPCDSQRYATLSM